MRVVRFPRRWRPRAPVDYGPFWPDGPMLGLDLETTGLDVFSDRPVSVALVTFRGAQVMHAIEFLIDPGVPIPPEVTEKHGVTDELARDAGVLLAPALDIIVGTLRDVGARDLPIVGQNVSFDLTVLDSCWRRQFGEPMPLIRPVVDLLVLDRHVDRFRRGSRGLSTLAPYYGVERGQRHQPTSDTLAAVRTVRALCTRYPAIGHRLPQNLHDEQVEWRYRQQRSFDRWLRRRGRPGIPPWEWRWPVQGPSSVDQRELAS